MGAPSVNKFDSRRKVDNNRRHRLRTPRLTPAPLNPPLRQADDDLAFRHNSRRRA